MWLFSLVNKKVPRVWTKVQLMPPEYVKPYVKTNKNDCIDADAIAG